MTVRDGEGGARDAAASPLDELADELFRQRGVRLLLKRDDLLGRGELTGNKYRKLQLNLAEAGRRGAATLLTFGGPYSNHLRAVAEAGRRFGFATIGIVRGDEPRQLNWSLREAAEAGMHLVHVDRSTYRRRPDPDYADELRRAFGEFYLVPEGGSNALGVRGCTGVVQEIDEDFDRIYCGCGTGGTLAGIAYALAPHQNAVGIAAFASPDFLRREVVELQQATFGATTGNWSLRGCPELGRFAAVNPLLAEFRAGFAERHGIVLEPTYVARMMYGLFTAVQADEVPAGRTVVAVVTGPAHPRDTDR